MPRLDAAAPSVQRHYNAFIPTTRCSAPVLRISNFDLTGTSCLIFSLNIGTTGSHVPYLSLIQIHAVFKPDAIQAGLQISACIYPEATTTFGSDVNDTISTGHQRFAFAHLSGSYLMESRSTFYYSAHHACSLQAQPALV
jgi:hypothetical protein